MVIGNEYANHIFTFSNGSFILRYAIIIFYLRLCNREKIKSRLSLKGGIFSNPVTIETLLMSFDSLFVKRSFSGVFRTTFLPGAGTCPRHTYILNRPCNKKNDDLPTMVKGKQQIGWLQYAEG
jgi:hypothetical protein